MSKPMATTLLLATPALLADSAGSGLLFTLTTGLISAVVWMANRSIRTLRAEPFQHAVLLIAAAAAAACCDLSLRAFAWAQHATVQPWLPLLAVIVATALPMQNIGIDNKRTLGALGLAITAPLFVGALREFSGALFVGLAPVIAISIGLVLAAVNRWLPSDAGEKNGPDDRKARRVRVTGPVS